MSEQSKIMAEMQEIIMNILKTGTATVKEGERIDALEAQLLTQNSFKESDDADYENQGEEIAGLFFNEQFQKAVNKMCLYEITPEDFFGFVEYHFDEDDDEDIIDFFTENVMADIKNAYQQACEA